MSAFDPKRTLREQGSANWPMRYELWYSASTSSYALLYEGDTSSDHVKEPDAKVVWTVEADTYEEALQKRNDFLGWGEYKSDDLPFDYPPKDRRR